MLSPPHSPLSVVITMAPTRLTVSRLTRNGWRYSVEAFDARMAMFSMPIRYGRDWRIRSWAFFIFEAATICMALVILLVLCTLLILLRISLDPAIAHSLPARPRAP